MNLESLHPLLTGGVGGLISILLSMLFSRWILKEYNGKTKEVLIREHQTGIWFANALMLGSLVLAFFLYHFGIIPNNDWRGLAVCLGSASIATIVVLPVVAIIKKVGKKESYVSYAIANKMPAVLLYGVLIIFILIGAIGAVS